MGIRGTSGSENAVNNAINKGGVQEQRRQDTAQIRAAIAARRAGQRI